MNIAEAFATDMRSEIRDGIHIARSKSISVADAGTQWIKTAEANVERSQRALTISAAYALSADGDGVFSFSLGFRADRSKRASA